MDRKAEMLYSLQELSQFGVETTVISARSMGLHGKGHGLAYERYDSLEVFRLYRDLNEMFVCTRLHYDEAFGLARKYDPDIILTSQEMTTRLSVSLAKRLNVPIVLWVENSLCDFARGKLGTGGRIPFGLLLALAQMPPTIMAWWNWISDRCDAFVTCNPNDEPFLGFLRFCLGKTVDYIPWPIGLDMKLAVQLRTRNKKKYGIYAGSLMRTKNIKEFSKTIPQILNNTPTEQFLFIGHGAEQNVITRLRRQFGNRILYIPDLPKEEVIKLIASAWYAYTPAKKVGSWQFIGDCWALGTPLLTTYESGYVQHQYNGLVVSPGEIVPAVNNLFQDKESYLKLLKGGFSTADDRHPKRIATKLFSTLKECMKAHSARKSRNTGAR
jgi:glycosyltransferase involved in cell wall biosynthesis